MAGRKSKVKDEMPLTVILSLQEKPMRRVTRSELLGVSMLALTAMLAVLTALLAGGCGGGEGLPALVTSPVNAPSQPALRPANLPTVSDDTVRPIGSSYLGDMDGDGLPSVGDAIKILRFVVGLDTPTATQTWLADVNGSTDVEVGDAIKVLRAVVSLEQWPLPWPGGGGGPPPPPF